MTESYLIYVGNVVHSLGKLFKTERKYKTLPGDCWRKHGFRTSQQYL
jgi:uncharacterized membrane protein